MQTYSEVQGRFITTGVFHELSESPLCVNPQGTGEGTDDNPLLNCHPLRKEKWSLGSKGHSIMVSRWLGVGCCFLRIHTRGAERHPAASLNCHCKIRLMPWVCSWFQVEAFERPAVPAGAAPSSHSRPVSSNRHSWLQFAQGNLLLQAASVSCTC